MADEAEPSCDWQNLIVEFMFKYINLIIGNFENIKSP